MPTLDIHNLERVSEDLRGTVNKKAMRHGSSTKSREVPFTYHLATTSGSTGNKFPGQGDSPSLGIHRARADEIIDGELDCFLRRDTLCETEIV